MSRLSAGSYQRNAFIDKRLDPRLHQVRAHVEEEQQTAEQEENGDQQNRDEPDEDVRERQFAADTPEKTLRHE